MKFIVKSPDILALEACKISPAIFVPMKSYSGIKLMTFLLYSSIERQAVQSF